jgi:hypothetical protein
MNEREHIVGPGTPPGLRATEAAVEELAGVERGGAPVALEDRVFMASRGLLPAGSAPVVVRARFLTRMRVAAVVALVGAGVTAWVAQSGRGEGSGDLAGLEQDVDFLLAVKTAGYDSTRQRIDDLFLDANSVGQSLKDIDWSPVDEGSL